MRFATAYRSARTQLARIVTSIRNADEDAVEREVLRLSSTRRWLAPLAFVVSSFVMLFAGLKLLVSNWRLTVVQVLPAMWIWVVMFDLRAHVLHGRSFVQLDGLSLAAVIASITALTTASFYLNAVFAFAITGPPPPRVGPANVVAWEHRRVVLAWGIVMGAFLAYAMILADRLGSGWFTITLSVAIGLLMVCYVAVPARVVGIQRERRSPRDRAAAALVGGAISVVVCTPPYVLARLGLLMLGSSSLRVVGVVLLGVGLTLQAGATGSVKALKMSAALVGGASERGQGEEPGTPVDEQHGTEHEDPDAQGLPREPQ